MKTNAHSVATRYRITKGKNLKLSDHKPAEKIAGLHAKNAKEILKKGLHEIQALQEVLYAENTWSLLIVIQGMDTCGKDGTIKHVMRGVNPQGCEVHAFKAPSSEELNHDFLWRCSSRLPQRGKIGIFNRSYYEEVLVVRVHPRILDGQRLPKTCLGKHIWRERFEDIVCFERHLARNGVKIVKLFLNISPDEQRRRLLARLDEKDKNWKFETGDLTERARWGDYMSAYEDMIRHTSTPDAPWHIIPANDKDSARFIAGAIVLDALRSLNLAYPKVGPEEMKELEKAKKALKQKK